MPQRYKYLLFDLDGTLVDSIPDIALSVNLLRGELDLPPLSIDEAAAMVGDGASLLVERATAELFKPELVKRFIAIYGEHLLESTRCYPGIEELLSRYPAERMAVVSNKPHSLTLGVLDGLGLSKHFNCIIGGDSLAQKKPHPQPVLEALKQLDASAEQSIMIGDNHTDLRAGRAAGTSVCFCAYGAGHSDGLACDHQVAHPRELLELFFGIDCA
jgi:phosphoglycolate phosphatase